MKKIISIFVPLLIIISNADAGSVKVVTTTMDMRSIAEMIGGNKVSVQSMRQVIKIPTSLTRNRVISSAFSNADLFVTVGLDLETGWSPQLLASSRNAKIQKGSRAMWMHQWEWAYCRYLLR